MLQMQHNGLVYEKICFDELLNYHNC